MVLMSSGAAGDRTIDVSVQSSATVLGASQASARAPSPSLSETADDVRNHDTGEVLRTLVIPTSSAFVVRQDVAYQRSLEPPPGLADLGVLEAPWECVSGEAVVTTVVECTAACGVEVEGVTLCRTVGVYAI